MTAKMLILNCSSILGIVISGAYSSPMYQFRVSGNGPGFLPRTRTN